MRNEPFIQVGYLSLYWIGLTNIWFDVLQITWKSLFFNSCVAFWRFFAKRLFFADSFLYDHRIKNYPQGSPLKFQYATFGSIKISGNEIFTGSEPEMTIFDRIGDFSESEEVN